VAAGDIAMNENQEHCTFPEGCRDQHLAMVPAFAAPFRQHGIRGAGLHEMVEPYEIQRNPVPWHIALLTYEGQGSYECGEESGVIHTNELWVGPANRRYSYKAIGDWKFLSAALYKIDTLVHLEGHVTKNAVHHPLNHLVSAVEAYLFESTLRDNEDSPMATALASFISQAILRELAPIKADDDIRSKLRLHELWEAVNASPGADWKLPDLAREAAVSVRQFQRLMRRYYDVTAEQMLTRLRMEHARELLSARDLSQATIAERVGYQSVYAFSKAFKRHFSHPPGTYAKLVLSDDPPEANTAR
jgi:AraC-like DNA-binding protein